MSFYFPIGRMVNVLLEHLVAHRQDGGTRASGIVSRTDSDGVRGGAVNRHGRPGR